MRPVFPFSAIVGQEDMKLALICSAVDPTIGGVLVFGDRGTGKSTAIRALAALLPPMRAVVGCRYACDPTDTDVWCSECRERAQKGELKERSLPVPVVDMPLGVTEDRVVGALDLERALSQGVKAFEPGLLARANRGFLYIDEVNLLEDHLVDLLIDVAASGENLVEREGLSVRHPARFVLIGSGNPEEGELRPQLLDRFGLSVEIKTPNELADRVQVIKRRDAFERDKGAFVAAWKKEDAALRRRIVAGRERLARVSIPDAVLESAAKLCMQLGTDGLRAELTLMRAARAHAGFEQQLMVDTGHLRRIATSALRHRLRRDPLDESGSAARIDRAVQETLGP
jgi:magnesium chelatase subunit I